MGTDELHEHAPERKGDVSDQPVFVTAEIEDDPVVAHEIYGSAELPLYLGRTRPLRLGAARVTGRRRNAPRLLIKQTARLLFANGRLVAFRRYGGTSP